MDTARAFPQMGHENPRVPTSPELDDELFDSFFDWQSYCDSTRADKVPPYHISRRSPPRDLTKLITEIPSVIDHISLERLESEFLRMKTSFSPDTPSDYSGQSPPELIQGGSTSPSDHSGSLYLETVEEPLRGPDVSLREVQAQDDEWTYPQTHPNKASSRGYPPSLQVQDGMSRRPFDLSSGLKRRRSGHASSERRHRQLADPDQTADVRKSGACLPCRATKIRCHESGVCPTCRKAFPDHAHLVCTRLTPAMVWPVIGRVPDVWASNPQEEDVVRQEPRFFFGKAREVSILMSTRDSSSPALRATIQAYEAEGDVDKSPTKAAFLRDSVPGHDELQQWVEAHIERETSSQFKYALRRFLLNYANYGYGLPKHDLVSKVHRMNCYFKIWKTPVFTCRASGNKLTNLPITVQAELRHIARKALESLEYDVLKQLDDCLMQQGPVKAEDKPAIWACVWQLMLMYRDLISAFESHITKMGAMYDAEMLGNAQATYQWLVDKVFPLITVFYHYQFRTKKSLEMSMDWTKAPEYSWVTGAKTIRKHAKDLFGSRKEWCEKIQKSKNETDRMLCVLVVNHELKKLNTRQRNPKGSSKS